MERTDLLLQKLQKRSWVRKTIIVSIVGIVSLGCLFLLGKLNHKTISEAGINMLGALRLLQQEKMLNLQIITEGINQSNIDSSNIDSSTIDSSNNLLSLFAQLQKANFQAKNFFPDLQVMPSAKDKFQAESQL